MKKPKTSNPTSQIEIQPPSDSDIERAAIYCLLMENKLIKNSNLKEKDFYHSVNAKVFGVICRMIEENRGADYVTLTSELKETNQLDEIGGPLYISSLGDMEPSTMFFKDYEIKLKELSARRELLHVAMKLCRAAKGNGSLASDIIEARSVLKEVDMDIAGKSRSFVDRVEDWLKVTDGNFKVTEMYRDLGIATESNKKAALMALRRLEEKGVVQKCGDRRGCWRPVSIDMEKMDFLSIESEEYGLTWPAAAPVHDLVKIYPGNLIVVAGEPNSGKTAMLLNLIRCNLEQSHIKSIRYLCSEGGAEELKVRLQLFERDGVPMEFWSNKKFSAWERSQDFAEVIDPDGFNLIDYLELYEEFYLVGKHLVHIQRKLNKGIAVIALQKDPKKDVGKGGFVILEKPRLVVNMMKTGHMKIIKGKNWRNHQINPDNRTYSYYLKDGCRFIAKKSNGDEPNNTGG